jgi:superfamily II DNA/RNA helicase
MSSDSDWFTKRRDLIGISETESGKTVAFDVPMCHYLFASTFTNFRGKCCRSRPVRIGNGSDT